MLDDASCAVGGIMIAVSGFELWPEAQKYNDTFAMIAGFVVGWTAIALTMSIGV